MKSGAQCNAFGLQRIVKCGEQAGTVDADAEHGGLRLRRIVADREDHAVRGHAMQPVYPRAFLHDPLGKAKPVQHGKPRGLDHQARTDRLRLGKTLENDDAIACPREQ